MTTTETGAAPVVATETAPAETPTPTRTEPTTSAKRNAKKSKIIGGSLIGAAVLGLIIWMLIPSGKSDQRTTRQKTLDSLAAVHDSLAANKPVPTGTITPAPVNNGTNNTVQQPAQDSLVAIKTAKLDSAQKVLDSMIAAAKANGPTAQPAPVAQPVNEGKVVVVKVDGPVAGMRPQKGYVFQGTDGYSIRKSDSNLLTEAERAALKGKEFPHKM